MKDEDGGERHRGGMKDEDGGARKTGNRDDLVAPLHFRFFPGAVEPRLTLFVTSFSAFFLASLAKSGLSGGPARAPFRW